LSLHLKVIHGSEEASCWGGYEEKAGPQIGTNQQVWWKRLRIPWKLSREEKSLRGRAADKRSQRRRVVEIAG